MKFDEKKKIHGVGQPGKRFKVAENHLVSVPVGIPLPI